MNASDRPGFTAPSTADSDALPSRFRALRSRVMYIENKSLGLEGPARIGRVYFSKTGKTLYYGAARFRSLKGSGFKANYYEVGTGDEYWISGPRKDRHDRLYGGSRGVEVDEDVKEEYWRLVSERLTSRSSGRAGDRVPSSHLGLRAAQLDR